MLDSAQPQLDEATCVRCGLCLQVCPTDGFTAALAYEQRLCETVAHLPLEPTALICAAHPTPTLTAAKVGAVVQHRRCLAALSVADLLELSSGGQRALWLDDSPCAACPIGAAQATLRQTVTTTRGLLHAAGKAPALLLHSERPPAPDTRVQRRPLFDGAQPAMSRRAFLARLRPSQPDDATAPPVEDWLQRGAPLSARLPQQLPASRQRLLAVLTALAGKEVSALATDGTPFAAVQVNAARCSACGLCARFCPSGALQFVAEATTFALSFQPAACVACGICVAACPEAAVSLDKSVALAAILADELVPLAAGQLAPCTSCGVPTAVLAGASAPRCYACRRGAGVVTSLKDEAGLMADLLKRTGQ